MTVMTSGMMNSATVEWETPKELFDKLDQEFHFTLDVCASPGMEKCKRYFSPEIDGLKQVWGGGRSMLYEPPVWKGDYGLGKESVPIPRDNRRVASSQDRYQVVQELGRTLRFGDTLHSWKGEVRGWNPRCTLPFPYSNMEHTAHTEIRGD